MAALQNLIPDPTTKGLWQCRPAAVSITNLASHGFVNASFISCLVVIGTRVYGMVSTTRNAGHDEPFCYDVPSNTFIPITGVTNANTPTSPNTFGDWNPPTMVLVGSKIIVAHPGFNGSANAYFGVIDVLNPFALTWTATNTAPTALVFPPQWVANFNGRCYFLVNPPNQQPAAYFSDPLQPLVITNGNQILTFQDNTSLTCAAGLSLSNQLGGIVQSLMVFKGVDNIYQVIGDAAFGTLTVNSLNVATGTFAPNSVQSTEKGLMFMAPDGVRLIDFNAHVSDPIGKDGDGITVPFLFAITPSRSAAVYNGGIYRVQVKNGSMAGAPQQDWWYDTVRTLWSGPHTTGMSLGQPYHNTFLITLQNGGASIFQSDQTQSITSTFVENGIQLTYTWLTSLLPDTDQMSEVAVIETTLHMALVSGQVVTCTAVDQDSIVLDQVTITGSGTATLWGQFNWGQAPWGGTTRNNALFPRRLAWTQPLVFRRMQLAAMGNSASALKIGRLHLKYQILGYLQQDDQNSVPLPFELDKSTLGGPDVLG
jgi:hypothetical protein